MYIRPGRSCQKYRVSTPGRGASRPAPPRKAGTHPVLLTILLPQSSLESMSMSKRQGPPLIQWQWGEGGEYMYPPWKRHNVTSVDSQGLREIRTVTKPSQTRYKSRSTVRLSACAGSAQDDGGDPRARLNAIAGWTSPADWAGALPGNANLKQGRRGGIAAFSSRV